MTISTRYTAVRRQTASKLGEPELQASQGDSLPACCLLPWNKQVSPWHSQPPRPLNQCMLLR